VLYRLSLPCTSTASLVSPVIYGWEGRGGTRLTQNHMPAPRAVAVYL
jgi:hypothetical protein